MEYRLPDWKIIDFHAHFPVNADDIFWKSDKAYVDKFGEEKLQALKKRSVESQAEWRRAWSFPDPEKRSDEWRETAKRWFNEVDKNNIDKIVFVTGGGNQWLQDIIKMYPDRFIGFAHHDPEEEDAGEKLEKAVVELGLKGYKIFAPTLTFPLSDKRFEPIWKVAEKHRLPILIHFGILGGGGGIANSININPLSIHDVAKGCPDIPFVIPHFGCGYPKELLHLCWVCENVYVDTSGNNEWVRWMPYDITLEDLFRKFYETVGPDRIVFGTDSEWFPRGYVSRYLLDQLRVCYQLRINEEDIKKIFRDNARKLLKL